MVSPIVIAGPTGSGKSAYALELARKIGGEIICADSRQVYIGMQIGTASPTADEKLQVMHHNYNFVDPAERYDAGRFVADTDRVAAEVASRGRVPILVGGTGLYLRCWRFGLSDVPESSPDLRNQLRLELEQQGVATLYEELKSVDEASAQSISPNDEFRILRALEIFRLTGNKPSDLRQSHSDQPRIDADWRLICVERNRLNERLLERTKQMFANGLVDEAVALRLHLRAENPLLSTIGYKESLAHADGHIDLATAIEQTFIRTRQYAKRQVSWFAKEPWWKKL